MMIHRRIFLIQRNNTILFLHSKKGRWFELPSMDLEGMIFQTEKSYIRIGTFYISEYAFEFVYELFHLEIKYERVRLDTSMYDYAKYIPFYKINQHTLSPHTASLFQNYEIIPQKRGLLVNQRWSPREKSSRAFHGDLI